MFNWFKKTPYLVQFDNGLYGVVIKRSIFGTEYLDMTTSYSTDRTWSSPETVYDFACTDNLENAENRLKEAQRRAGVKKFKVVDS